MTTTITVSDGVDAPKPTSMVEDVEREPLKGRIAFSVGSEWIGASKARHTVSTSRLHSSRNRQRRVRPRVRPVGAMVGG
jgi:hypothetical protein